jgi:5-(carboxyamino)imidazole ribonucleotide synthase
VIGIPIARARLAINHHSLITNPMTSQRIFLPGSTIGVMGGGQLGRMFAIAARRMGYRVHTFSPDEDTPTGQLADREVAARYDDEAAVRDFARGVDVLTFEFENIPGQCIEWAAEHLHRAACRARPPHLPAPAARERSSRSSRPAAPAFKAIASAGELAVAVAEIGVPAVIKTASFGYDGKGQRKLDPGDTSSKRGRPSPARPRCSKPSSPSIANSPCSSPAASMARCAPSRSRNDHANHILDVTVIPSATTRWKPPRANSPALPPKRSISWACSPSRCSAHRRRPAHQRTRPPPHNSGHWSFDAAVTSQFEQQLRAVCGLPLGATDALRPAAMANLLGDLWAHGEPHWARAAAFPEVKIHLYGKADARPGRKMGHLVAFGDTGEQAAQRVHAAREALVRPE